MVRLQEGRAQNRIIPVEDDAGLGLLGFVLRSEPDFVVSEPREQLRANLLVRAR